ncbi:hypothetical protein D9758_013249 [Tetrapyrgos nigripes]|uniref:Major facilitator superfamily (MFS) profile domain-containing protein n=1 Tax=Tetrapyrgos nigripes TaxID=182062 RepID=A0A8H5CM38_9AGAR|nr:hypothetical protein D9758_013249 [Tetrapyrgos nigripes]
MLVPGLPAIAEQYGITLSTVVALVLTIFLLTFAIGPLFLAALSKMYGCTWILHGGVFFSIIFNLACTYAPNTGSLIAFRFIAMALYSVSPLIGPVIGPVTGGFIAETIGPNWVFIVIAALSSVSFLIGIPFLRETYAPVIWRRRTLASGDVEKANISKTANLLFPTFQQLFP